MGCLRRNPRPIGNRRRVRGTDFFLLGVAPYNPLRSSVGIPENWIVDFRGGAESKVQWNRIPLAGCRAVCSAPHSLGISDIGSLTAPADGDGGLWAAPPLLVATARLPPVGRAEVVSHPRDDIGLAIWHFGNPSNRQLLNEGTSLVRSSLRRPRMDLIAVFAYTEHGPALTVFAHTETGRLRNQIPDTGDFHPRRSRDDGRDGVSLVWRRASRSRFRNSGKPNWSMTCHSPHPTRTGGDDGHRNGNHRPSVNLFRNGLNFAFSSLVASNNLRNGTFA